MPAPLETGRLIPGPTQDPRLAGAAVEVIDSLPSTNDELVRRLAEGPEGAPGHLHALLTEHQTAGRGRRDRTWTTPRGSSAIVSFAVLPAREDAAWPTLPPESLHWLTLLLALAVRGAIREQTGLPAELKWPNDLLVGGRKVAGILARAAHDAAGRLGVVVGVGVNTGLRPQDLPSEAATSLLIEAGEEVDRTELLIGVVERFRRLVADFEVAGGSVLTATPGAPALLETVRGALDTLGRRVRVQRSEGQPDLIGLARDVDADGALVVRADDGALVAVSVGDVVHLRPESGTWGPGAGAAGTTAPDAAPSAPRAETGGGRP